MTGRWLLPVATLTLLLAGCAGGSDDDEEAGRPTVPTVVDSQEVEQALVNAQKRQTPDLDVRDPSCPARVVVSEAATFECTIAVESVVVPYKVTLAGTGTSLRYNIAPAKAILLMPKLVDALQRNAPGSRIDCGADRVKPLDVGATFDCTVTDQSGRAQPVTLRVNDLQGNVSQVPGP